VSAFRKPVIVRRLTLDWCAGYAAANPATPDTSSGNTGLESGLELLLSSGKLLSIPLDQIKWVCYVRDLGPSQDAAANDSINPERLLRRRFAGRPRVAGVWLRLILSDGEELEGVAANDRSLVDSAGLLLTPPDTRSNTQRVFIPRTSIRELTVLGIIQPSAQPTPGGRERTGQQAQLFEMKPVERNPDQPSDSPPTSLTELQSHP